MSSHWLKSSDGYFGRRFLCFSLVEIVRRLLWETVSLIWFGRKLLCGWTTGCVSNCSSTSNHIVEIRIDIAVMSSGPINRERENYSALTKWLLVCLFTRLVMSRVCVCVCVSHVVTVTNEKCHRTSDRENDFPCFRHGWPVRLSRGLWSKVRFGTSVDRHVL